jgi:hypothetical protein
MQGKIYVFIKINKEVIRLQPKQIMPSQNYKRGYMHLPKPLQVQQKVTLLQQN